MINKENGLRIYRDKNNNGNNMSLTGPVVNGEYPPMPLHNFLHRLRVGLRLSRTKLSLISHISYGDIKLYEEGSLLPSTDHFKRLSSPRALNFYVNDGRYNLEFPMKDIRPYLKNGVLDKYLTEGEDHMPLQDFLSYMRWHKSKTQTEVERDTGISKRMISAYEKGVNMPSPRVMEILGEYYGFDCLEGYADFPKRRGELGPVEQGSVGEAIRKKRIELGLSQEEFGSLLGEKVGQNRVSQLEHQTWVYPETAKALTAAGVKICESQIRNRN